MITDSPFAGKSRVVEAVADPSRRGVLEQGSSATAHAGHAEVPDAVPRVDDPDTVPATAPQPFQDAVASLLSTQLRREIRVETIRPPQRLAPWSFAVALDLQVPSAADDDPAAEAGTGRLVVLYDPDGLQAWDGEIRVVGYAQAALTDDLTGDPLLAAVSWTWLTESLDARLARYTAVGGTVTQTTSTRFGDTHGPHSTSQLELRGSWTALDGDLGPHLLAFGDLLCAAAGLAPEGVAALGDR